MRRLLLAGVLVATLARGGTAHADAGGMAVLFEPGIGLYQELDDNGAKDYIEFWDPGVRAHLQSAIFGFHADARWLPLQSQTMTGRVGIIIGPHTTCNLWLPISTPAPGTSGMAIYQHVAHYRCTLGLALEGMVESSPLGRQVALEAGYGSVGLGQRSITLRFGFDPEQPETSRWVGMRMHFVYWSNNHLGLAGGFTFELGMPVDDQPNRVFMFVGVMLGIGGGFMSDGLR